MNTDSKNVRILFSIRVHRRSRGEPSAVDAAGDREREHRGCRSLQVAVGLIQKLMPQTHAALSGRGALCGALEDIENTGPAGVIGGHDAQ